MHHALFVVLAVVSMGSCVTSGASNVDALPPVSTADTVLGVGDVVEVRVFGEPDLTGIHQVSQSGQIRLPLIGAMDVAGETPDALAKNIESKYNASFLKSAQVSLFVKEQVSRSVYVLGQVARPGPLPVAAKKLTVIEAIALAGGTTKNANANSTLLTRTQGDKTIRVIVQVGEIGVGRVADVDLQVGDILFVPESPY
jgi:polysaccharide biosynthesis/export protein